ncbi:hypothetical protein HDU67_006415 [Dinochytrium kinnereticum]|nr:hypothetical protein HDU67_006415 [Dinochytrium kinnereticum]
MAATTATSMTSAVSSSLPDTDPFSTHYGTSPSGAHDGPRRSDTPQPPSGGVTAASALVEMGGSGKVHKEEAEGSSTLQSVFNTCGGWIPGLTILISTALITSYTALILSRCLSLRPGRLHDFADIGSLAFGPQTRTFISLLFITELYITCVAFIILISDSLHALSPSLSMTTCRVIAFVACTGSTFVRQLKYVSYASLVGIGASVNLVLVLVLDGVMKGEGPGSLWDVERTLLVPENVFSVSLAFGIVMAGFAGHAVLPNIYLDMKDKTQFPRVLAISFSIALALYMTVAVCGYLMFGESTLEEVTKNLALPGNSVNPVLDGVATGLIAFVPVPK